MNNEHDEKDSSELTSTDRALYYDTYLDDFLNESRKKDTEYKVNLFKVNAMHKNASGRQKHEFLKAYYGYVPGWEEVGAEFGPGEYRLNCTFTTKKNTRGFKSQDVTISDRFGSKPNQATPAAAATAAPAMQNGMGEYLQLLQSQNQTMMQAMFTLMDRVVASVSKPAQESPSFEKMQTSLNSIFLTSAKQQQELISTMTKRNMEEVVGEPVPDETLVTEIFGVLKYVWENYGEKILKGTKAFKKDAKKEMQNNAQLKQILEQPAAYSAAYDRLIEDAPEADVIKLLNIIGVPTPTEVNNTVPMQQVNG